MRERKTNEKFVEEICGIVGDEYVFLEEYQKSSIKIKVRHNSRKCNFHEYKVTPNNFLKGQRCPKCMITKKPMTNSEFVKRVYKLVGDEYEFLDNYTSSAVKLLCRHNKCGLEYKVTPASFTYGVRCKTCSDKEAVRKRTKTNETFLKEVDTLVGDEYEFLEKYTTNFSNIKVKHNSCGYEWKVRPSNFMTGTRCPNCFGNPRKTRELFVEEVRDVLGEDYRVLGLYKNSNTKIDMKHERCGHEYSMLPLNILRGQMCPKCKSSQGEIKVGDFLTSVGVKYEPQLKFDDCRKERPLPFDFGIRNHDGEVALLIEYDGNHHYEPINLYGGMEYLKSTQYNDNIKNNYCYENNIPLLRIPYWEFDELEVIIFDKLVELNILQEVLV